MTKISHKETGNIGEQKAAEFLVNKDYEIIARNYRWARGEIDIIAKNDNTLVFVEVKTATNTKFGAPETWVDERKQRQIGMAAEHYLQEKQIDDLDCRFDVVAVTVNSGEWRIQHIENAFWLEADET